LQRIDDAPARGRIHDDEFAPERGDLADVTVPDQQALVEAAHFLHERCLPMQPGLGDHVADRFAELHDDGLFGLVDDVRRARDDPCNDGDGNGNER
jgi:hypothetical protein